MKLTPDDAIALMLGKAMIRAELLGYELMNAKEEIERLKASEPKPEKEGEE